MKITYAIQATPRRVKYAQALMDSLQGEHVEIAFDFFMQGSWSGAKKAWLKMPEDSTHHSVLQEDVMICRNFAEHVRQIVEILPDKIICFYGSPYQKAGVVWAKKNDYSYFISEIGPAAQGFIMPAWMVKDFLEWERTRIDQRLKGDDPRYHGYVVERAKIVYYTVPSLIEHIAPCDSVMGHNNKGKVAADFLGDREQDWTKVPPEGLWYFRKKGAVSEVWRTKYVNSHG